MWNGTMFVDLDWPLNASSLLSASAELLVSFCYERNDQIELHQAKLDAKQRKAATTSIVYTTRVRQISYTIMSSAASFSWTVAVDRSGQGGGRYRAWFKGAGPGLPPNPS